MLLTAELASVKSAPVLVYVWNSIVNQERLGNGPACLYGPHKPLVSDQIKRLKAIKSNVAMHPFKATQPQGEEEGGRRRP